MIRSKMYIAFAAQREEEGLWNGGVPSSSASENGGVSQDGGGSTIKTLPEEALQNAPNTQGSEVRLPRPAVSTLDGGIRQPPLANPINNIHNTGINPIPRRRGQECEHHICLNISLNPGCTRNQEEKDIQTKHIHPLKARLLYPAVSTLDGKQSPPEDLQEYLVVESRQSKLSRMLWDNLLHLRSEAKGHPRKLQRRLNILLALPHWQLTLPTSDLPVANSDRNSKKDLPVQICCPDVTTSQTKVIPFPRIRFSSKRAIRTIVLKKLGR